METNTEELLLRSVHSKTAKRRNVFSDRSILRRNTHWDIQENTGNTIVLQRYNLELHCNTKEMTLEALTLEMTEFWQIKLGT